MARFHPVVQTGAGGTATWNGTFPHMPHRPAVIIRRATADDAASLAAVARRTFIDTFAAHNAADDMAAYIDASYSTALQARELADPDRVCLVAECDGMLIGFAQMQDSPPPPCVPPRPSIEIQRFYLDRSEHGSGLAQRLMRECEAVASARGASAMHLGVWEHNTRALRFYAAQGFVEVGARSFGLGTDVQRDLVLVRQLASIGA